MTAFVHRDLDPRSKLAFVLAVVAVAVAIPSMAALTGLGLLLTALVAVGGGLGLREWIGSLAAFRFVIPVILVLNAVFYGGGSVVWRVPPGWLAVTTGGLETSAVIASRLVVIAAVAAWFAATTDAEAFEAALVDFGVPWTFAFTVSLSVSLVPALRDRFRAVEEAQRARGVSYEGGPVARIRARVPVFVPFLAGVVEYGFELAEALVVRDFGTSDQRTSVVTVSHGRADLALYALSLATVAGFVAGFGP